MSEKAMINFNTLIRIQGAEDTGKTSSISRAFLQILEKKPLVNYFKYYEKGDFLAIVEFENKYVAFCSSGDDLGIVKRFELLNQYALEKSIIFDIFVVAHRTKGQTCKIIKKCLEQNTQAQVKEFKSLTKGEFWEENEKFLYKEMEQCIEQTSKKLYECICELLKI
ncbi:hypothetical protein K4888_000943 [Campylobacter upsaliensis]|uniref:hypothetical protein n=1 Tax=Campylobacter upsaliensis TaxID=28080 RepID=UPI00126A997D|nr:hypothetical protein [Campylobacter upsaliensis]EAH7597930.1 hypothetical protein [Campylobacter upsaliensis]EAI3917336.1 hypothetical protein [Campylobacter upsaliensis]EAI8564076.1 hypothetical protein [Campylobacter upsaliensis]EAJ7390277.1 hypothetical protein [Campylobacter upsaliensis]EAJ7577241.1 hypothetical protein [Campylobacter upsaliensis]